MYNNNNNNNTKDIINKDKPKSISRIVMVNN